MCAFQALPGWSGWPAIEDVISYAHSARKRVCPAIEDVISYSHSGMEWACLLSYSHSVRECQWVYRLWSPSAEGASASSRSYPFTLGSHLNRPRQIIMIYHISNLSGLCTVFEFPNLYGSFMPCFLGPCALFPTSKCLISYFLSLHLLFPRPFQFQFMEFAKTSHQPAVIIPPPYRFVGPLCEVRKELP